MPENHGLSSAFHEPNSDLNLPFRCGEEFEINEVLEDTWTLLVGNSDASEWPATNRVGISRNGAVVFGLAPDQWLIAGWHSGSPGMYTTDHSHAWVVLRVIGVRASDILQALCPVDLHPSEFGDRMCFQTSFRGNRVLVARTQGISTTNSFDLVISRSSARAVLEDISDMATRFRPFAS